MFYGLSYASHGSDVVALHAGHFDLTLPRNRLLSFSLESVTRQHSHTITAINIPAIFIEILVSLPTSWPSSWHPPQLSMDSWRSLTFPIFCLPAWWLVGRGIDGLLGRKRLHWATLSTGSVLFVLFVIGFVGITFSMSAEERADSHWVLWGLAFWILAFSVLPLTWFLRRPFRETRSQLSESMCDSEQRPA
jgi:hypothetical protein